MGYGDALNRVYKETINWTSDGSGDASVETSDFTGHLLLSAVVTPGENGDKTTDCPTTLYDAVINDAYGEDIMEEELADGSASLSKSFYADPPIPIHGKLTLVISNAGNTKQGQVILMFKGMR